IKSKKSFSKYLCKFLLSPFFRCLLSILKEHSLNSLSFAILHHFSINSTPYPSLSNFTQALIVDPVPRNGSKTLLPFFVKKLINFPTSVYEKGAGCNFSN